MLGLHACPTLPRICVECQRCHTQKMVNDFLWVSGRQPVKCLEYHFILCSLFYDMQIDTFGGAVTAKDDLQNSSGALFHPV